MSFYLRAYQIQKFKNRLQKMNQQMSQIIDGVFFQKLSLMLGSLQSWEKQKEEAFDQMYGHIIEEKRGRIESKEKEVKNQLLQFIKILNQQYSFLAKLKKEEKEVEVSAAFPVFQQFSTKFNTIKQSLLELTQFLGKFIGVTNYQYTEIRKVHQEALEIKNRYNYQKNKFLHTYNSKKQLSYSKKNMKKHFELGKYFDLLALLQKERKIHEEIYLRIHNTLVRDMDIRVRMYKDITQNLKFATQLYEKGFKENDLSQLIVYFKDKYQKAEEERKLFQQTEESIFVSEEPYQQLKKQFLKYFDTFLEEITVANWNISFQNKEELPQRPENKIVGSMIVTFDNKILLFRNQTRQIFFQQTIEDLKVYPPETQGIFNIKDKRVKVKFQVEFQKSQQEDEFFLHLKKMASK